MAVMLGVMEMPGFLGFNQTADSISVFLPVSHACVIPFSLSLSIKLIVHSTGYSVLAELEIIC
jgi:hypothetical protein